MAYRSNILFQNARKSKVNSLILEEKEQIVA